MAAEALAQGPDAPLEPLVCDANVIAKWFFSEEWSSEARSLLNSRRALFAPDLLVPELGSIFREKVLAGEMSLADIGPALDVVNERVSVVSSSEAFLDGVTLAISTGRSFYDCLYLALAIALGCRFLTADERFINAVRSRFEATLLWLGDVKRDV